jgi:hypothetical protein
MQRLRSEFGVYGVDSGAHLRGRAQRGQPAAVVTAIVRVL